MLWGTQKNRRDEMVLLKDHSKHMFKLMGKNIITMLR